MKKGFSDTILTDESISIMMDEPHEATAHYATNISAFFQRLEELARTLTQTTGNVTDLITMYGNLVADLETLRSSLDRLEQATETKTQSLEENIMSIDQLITATTNYLTAMTSNLTTLEGNLNATSRKIDNLTQRMENLESKTPLGLILAAIAMFVALLATAIAVRR